MCSDSDANSADQIRSRISDKMNEFESSGAQYGRSLFAASMVSAGTGSIAWIAQRHRLTMINLPQMGRWFRAIDELLAALGMYYIGFRRTESLSSIAFLIERAIRDFQVVVEASLSGLRSASFDTLRDTMEIEYLLNDFYHEPSHIDEWLNAKTSRQIHKFRPISMREREAERQNMRVADLQSDTDYKIHSQSLHVNSVHQHTAMRGVHEYDETLSLFPMYELFFHGAGVLTTLMQYHERLDEDVLKQMENLSMDRFFTVWGEIRNELARIQGSHHH